MTFIEYMSFNRMARWHTELETGYGLTVELWRHKNPNLVSLNVLASRLFCSVGRSVRAIKMYQTLNPDRAADEAGQRLDECMRAWACIARSCAVTEAAVQQWRHSLTACVKAWCMHGYLNNSLWQSTHLTNKKLCFFYIKFGIVLIVIPLGDRPTILPQSCCQQ